MSSYAKLKEMALKKAEEEQKAKAKAMEEAKANIAKSKVLQKEGELVCWGGEGMCFFVVCEFCVVCCLLVCNTLEINYSCIYSHCLQLSMLKLTAH